MYDRFFICVCHEVYMWDLPHISDGKESACSAGDLGSIPGLERSSGEGNGNTVQYSCPVDSMDRGGLVGCNCYIYLCDYFKLIMS